MYGGVNRRLACHTAGTGPTSRAGSGVHAAMCGMAGLLLVLFLMIGLPGGAHAGSEDAADKIRRF